jgi:two-component sensor histidine kinase
MPKFRIAPETAPTTAPETAPVTAPETAPTPAPTTAPTTAPKTAPAPERLSALHRYEILDTDREAAFDDIAELARGICSAPIALISFVTDERQWFKAEIGLGARETSLGSSICAYALVAGDFLEIADTWSDQRTFANPLCRGDDGLRFYAGAVLKSRDGLAIGSLCVLDRVPRRLTPLQRDALRVLANQVMTQLDLRAALREAEMLRQEVDHRVKNSLQSVSSLTRLQARASRSEEVRASLGVVERRIETVAALHGEMYLTHAGGRIDLGRYIANVGRLIEAVRPRGVAVEIDVESVEVGSREASAVAVIVNEAATNAFKHAFPGGRAGKLRIIGRRTADHGYELECSDDGAGANPDADPDASCDAGLGLRIVEASVTQLSGVSEVTSDATGFCIKVRFPV